MKPLDFLLSLVARADADALLLHGGERAILLSESGQAPVPGVVLTTTDLENMLATLLPDDRRRTLLERGSIDHRWTGALPDGGDVALTAIRAGADLWVELRRHDASRQGATPPAAVIAARDETGHNADVQFEPWIRRAHETGAEAVIVAGGARPMAKLKGEVRALTETNVSPVALQRALVRLAERLAREGAVERDGALEWALPDVGIVACRINADRRGPGVFFELQSTTAVLASVPLSDALREVVVDGDGLILVGGRTVHDRIAMAHALVDAVNRQRAAHIICLQQTRTIVHDHHRGLVSQRIVEDEAPAAWEIALDQADAERPDVVMLDAPACALAADRALNWAAGGTLVIMTVPAATTVAALRMFIESEAVDDARAVAKRCAAVLSAAAAVTTVPKRGGGRATACELLIGTSAVLTLVAECAFDRLSLVLERCDEASRSLTLSLSELVAADEIALRSALRLVSDPTTLLTAVRRAKSDPDVKSASDSLNLTALLDSLART